MTGIGDRFPDYSLPDENGEMFRSGDIAGVRYVLYFYLEDGSEDCATEAREFSGALPKFMLRNIPIVGVSPDPPESHRRFFDAEGLRVKLLSDTDGSLAASAGTGGCRCTFIIGKDGTVEARWDDVAARGHAEKVLEKAVILSKKQM